MAEELMAASRDASWYKRPDVTKPKRVHVAAVYGREGKVWSARCDGRVPLDEMTGQAAANVPEHLRCHRRGCAVWWPRTANCDNREGS